MTSSSIEFKSMPGQVNVDEALGIVECFVAGIGNKDSVGDVLIAGAFTKSLTRRKPRVVWGHNWNDPIGKVLEIYEVAPGDRRLPVKMLTAGIGGLYARVQFNLNSEKGREAFANVAFFGQEQEWSIGYKTLDAIFDPNIQANVLKEVELYEVSPVLHGANQLTGTISVKSDDLTVSDSGKGWDMMGNHQMMGQMPMKPNVIVIREDGDDDKYESEKPIFAEGLSQPISGSQRQSLEKEIMERTGSQVRIVEATESTAIFQRMMPNGTPMTFRIGYHTPDDYSTFMFGKPELVKNPNNAPGSRVMTPSQMPSMQIQVKPGYEQNYENIMPSPYSNEKSDISSQLLNLEKILMSEIDEKVGKTINKKNLSKLKQILENLQDVIASAEKEDLETKGYLIPVEIQEAFHTKSLLDPILDYHRVESIVTEDGIFITSGVTKDLIDAINTAQKGIGRALDGAVGKGRAAGRAAFTRFDPKAWDGDGDGIVQEGTPFQRPAIPGINDRATGGKVNVPAATRAFNQQSGFASRTSINESSNGQRIVPSRMHSDDREMLAEVTDPEERKKKIDGLIEFYGRKIFAKPSNPRKKSTAYKKDEDYMDLDDNDKEVVDVIQEAIESGDITGESLWSDWVSNTLGDWSQEEQYEAIYGRPASSEEIQESADQSGSKYGDGEWRGDDDIEDEFYSEAIADASPRQKLRALVGESIPKGSTYGDDAHIAALRKSFSSGRSGFASTTRGDEFNRQIKPESRVVDSAIKMLTNNREYIAERMMPGRNREILDENWVDETIKNLKNGEISHLDAMNIMNLLADIVGKKIREDPSLRDATSGEVFHYQKLSKRLRRAMVDGVSSDDMDKIRRGQGISRNEITKPRGFTSRSTAGEDFPVPGTGRTTRDFDTSRAVPMPDEPDEEIMKRLEAVAKDRDSRTGNGGGKWKGKKPADSDIKPDADLSGADLSGAKLGGKDLSGANLSGANLLDADLSGADLTDANLQDAILTYAVLAKAKLIDADLRDANLKGADLTGADIRDANLSFADLTDTKLVRAYLEGANLSGADLTKADLTNADLTDADLSLAKLRDVSLRGANLTGADLGGADLRGRRLESAEMASADLSGANLSGADLRRANLTLANLKETNLAGADLTGANLSDTNMKNADLEGANLTDANLTDADLTDADLINAKLRGANLTNATGVKNLSDEQQGEILKPKPKGGFASRGRDASRDSEDSYDERFGPVEPRPNRGMQNDPVGDEAAGRLDIEKRDAAVREGIASRTGRTSSKKREMDMTLAEYAELDEVLKKYMDESQLDGIGADEDMQVIQNILDKLDESSAANDSIPLTDKEIDDYMDTLARMRDNGPVEDSADKESIDKLINSLKKTKDSTDGKYESDALQKAGTRLSPVSTRGKAGGKKQTKEGTLSPSKTLSITLEEDGIGQLREEIEMLLDYTKDKQPLLGLKKILEDSKNGKFEVTPEQFNATTKAIEEAFDNGVVTSDLYQVMHQAAESLDGKFDIGEIINPPKPKKGFASSGKLNNGAPSDITESLQKQYIMWGRQQTGLKIVQSIIQDFDRNGGWTKASNWKGLRTMYSNMGPGNSSPRRSGGFRSRTSTPVAGFRDVGLPQSSPLPYVHKTTGWKKIGGAGGLNAASKMQDPKTGKIYYVKHSEKGEEFRGESEILTSKLYRLLGIPTINYERGEHNGRLQRVSEWDSGIKTVDHRSMSRDTAYKTSVQNSLIANAWLANWDGTGNMSNIVQGPNGEAIMADSGGGLIFRAQTYSGMKGQKGTDPFGARVEEVFNLINGKTRSGVSVQAGVSRAYYGDIEPEEIARQVKELKEVTDDEIRKLVAQTISNKADGDRLAAILIARRDWIVDHWSTGKFVEKPQDTSVSDASGSKVRAFASSSRGFASGGIDGPGDDGPSSRQGIRVRDIGRAVPGGEIEGRGRTAEDGLDRGDNSGLTTKFAGKSFDEVKPSEWDELTTDEKWQWAMTLGNPDSGGEMSRVAYKKLLNDLRDEEEKEEQKKMSPQQRAAKRREDRDEKRKFDDMGVDDRSIEEIEAKRKARQPKETKPQSVTKIKKSKNAEDAKAEREKRLDAFLEFADTKKTDIQTDESESDDHRDLWDEVSTALQDNGYDFSVNSLDKAISVLDDYIGNFDDEQLTPGERKNLTAAKKMIQSLYASRNGYATDEWIAGGVKPENKPASFASSTGGTSKAYSKKLASDIQKDIRKIQGTNAAGVKGFASTSSGGKTLITDEATFFKDIESSLDKEIRKARNKKDLKAVKGLSKLLEIIRRDEASKTGSRRTNVGSIYFTAEEADEILDGLMFALDTQLDEGGEKRIAWYAKLIELIATSAKSTFIDKTTSEITKTTRTAVNSQGQKKKINIIPEA